MKSIGILMMVLMLASIPAVFAEDSVPSAPAIRLSLLNQDPDPVEPGNFVEMRWIASNVGFTDAKDVTFEILLEHPFSLLKGVSATQEYGLIAANPDEGESVLLYYKLLVDDAADEGTYEIDVRYRMGDGAWRVAQQDYDVRVRTFDSYLSVNKITSEPGLIEPGQTSTVTLELKNEGDTTIVDAKVNLGLNDATIPLSPVGSSNEKIITLIEKGQMASVSFTIAAEPEAVAGLYTIPLTLTYRDVNGQSYSSSKLMSLSVGGVPDLIVILDETDIMSSGTKGKVSLRFINKGVTDVKFLDVKILNSDAFQLLSVNEVYIGNVDSDDYETADFEIYVKSTADSVVKLPITYEYRDANNKPYSVETQLDLRLYSGEELKQYGFGNGSKSSMYAVVVVVLVLGFFIWRRWKKKRKQK